MKIGFFAKIGNYASLALFPFTSTICNLQSAMLPFSLRRRGRGMRCIMPAIAGLIPFGR